MAFSVLLLGLASLSRWRCWRLGRHDVSPSLSALKHIPRRYLVNVHEVVARQPRAARMHVRVAGGLAFAALFTLLALCELMSGPLPATAIAVGSIMGLYGAWLDHRRRSSDSGYPLPGGAYRYLPLWLSLASLFFLLIGPLAALNWLPSDIPPLGAGVLLIGALSLPGLALTVLAGPMRHAVAGALHLAWHPRPERFVGRFDTALEPVTLYMREHGFGVATARDMGWQRLLGLDACVQCGRCETACPAFAAGLPLNPRAMVNEILASLAPVSYQGTPHPGQAKGAGTSKAPGELIASDTLWSCTTCRACVDACPMMIEHVDAVIDMRRYQTLERAAAPGQAPEKLESLDETDTLCGRRVEERLDFAAGMNLPRLVSGAHVDVLLWVGEGGFDARNQRSLRALVTLLRAARVDFAVLAQERDCGDTARRLGDELTFERLAQANIATLAALDFDCIVTPDPHAAHCLAREYPALGGHYRVEHHTRFLAALVRSGQLRLHPDRSRNVTYHDPCYLSRYLDETESPRALIARSGGHLHEMACHGRASFCCGAGGGAALTDIPGEQRIPDLRMAQACATEAEILVVACPNCTHMLEGVTGKHPPVVEISEFLLEALAREVS